MTHECLNLFIIDNDTELDPLGKALLKNQFSYLDVFVVQINENHIIRLQITMCKPLLVHLRVIISIPTESIQNHFSLRSVKCEIAH